MGHFTFMVYHRNHWQIMPSGHFEVIGVMSWGDLDRPSAKIQRRFCRKVALLDAHGIMHLNDASAAGSWQEIFTAMFVPKPIPSNKLDRPATSWGECPESRKNFGPLSVETRTKALPGEDPAAGAIDAGRRNP